jgi:hypothetical protein
VAGAVRTDVPANIPEPTTLPNPVVQGLNPNQLALVGFSRYLETKTMGLAQEAGPVAARAMTLEIGKRLLWSSEEDRHGEVAVARVDRFFELARKGAPAPAGAKRAKKKATKKTPVKTAAVKKAVSTKGAAKKGSKVSAKNKTKVERKASPTKGKVHPLVKMAAKEIAKRAAKAVAKKALAKAVSAAAKKSAKRSRR